MRALSDKDAEASMDPTEVLDELDKKIILQLSDDGRKPYRQIARDLGVAEGTVRLRANRLMDKGYIRVAAVGNALQLGVEVIAVTLLRVEPRSIADVAKELTTHRNVRFVAASFGSADIIIQTLHRSQKELHRFLTDTLPNAMPAIKSMETFQLAEVLKSSWDWEAWFSLPKEDTASKGDSMRTHEVPDDRSDEANANPSSI